MKLLRTKVERIAKKVKTRSIILNTKPVFKPNYNVHIFYYAWYGNQDVDGYYKHWNHNYLPNWQNEKKVHSGSHKPILDIGSNFYPSLGCYSSQDPNVIDAHMKQLRENGVGVIVVSWSPPNTTDSPYKILPVLFRFATKHYLKIALHIEPYFDRNPLNLIKHLQNYLLQYRNHPALYKIKTGQKEMPVFYVYDSYLTPAVAWMEVLSAKGASTIRGGELDAVFIGLLVDIQHRYHIKKSHFDGFYTYFAANSFSYGSTWKNWKSLAKFATQNNLLFIPSVGPGYADTRVRPWNSKTTRHRRHGQYYDVAWRTAISSGTKYVSITSFNEWHEGTQIEPAIPKNVPEYSYLDYEPEGSHFYLNLTKWWIEQFGKC
ncbi:hypothetical protein RN001_016447 [Aquatica leii]|uniref:Glycoprotein endo-alpha-1,2-mannosidase n=1 Tax=Aquatica leii TaxID=1421715 RepID=A0AAN7S5Q6_9COLE|nr:hypothetical protein RN001_016447 [Aquatica leii]